VSAWTDALIAAATVQNLNARIDALLVMVHAAGTHSARSARCARAHAALLEEYRTAALRAVA
jgi:hypothetical protein